ncbi:uncharacterized protein BXIN_3029 [Babesia sp. Xinjiang]|uniref:uncharacterized protein n=1 Tax=Babesia sp. Xinjiang TaxID=462227 RepID=UPI000A24E6CB|nr:uncharacterized protein BXIN_3029 [Babesia sp. Xinjiang]ORM39422.1 hypothetical protein BXIN_3029 [Babesia sp. Xinjiang]
MSDGKRNDDERENPSDIRQIATGDLKCKTETITLRDLSSVRRGDAWSRRRQRNRDDVVTQDEQSHHDDQATHAVADAQMPDTDKSVALPSDLSILGPSEISCFENTILDPKVDIGSIQNKGSDNNYDLSASSGSRSSGSNELFIPAKGGALARSPNGPQDWRANAVSTIPKDPVVPYADVLKRIRSNYKLRELSEEDYVGCLETIIERDYFPDLVKLRIKNLLMEAESRGDTARAEYLREKLEHHDKDQEMNVKLRTVGNEDVSVNIGKGGLKLDQFSRIFTSEDNRSFGRLMEQSIVRNNELSGWMEEGERKHNMALANTQSKTNLGITDKNIQSNRSVSRNALFFNQNSEPDRNKGGTPFIRATNTAMPSDHDEHMAALECRQKARRTEKVKDAYHGKVNDLITQFGLRECKELVDEEQMERYDFVQTPLTSVGEVREYSVPKPIAREDLAERLRKKYQSKTSATPMAKTPSCRTPLLVQKLIAKHNSMADLQLRSSYNSSKYSKGSVRSGVIFKS